jgi:hypothetical protein
MAHKARILVLVLAAAATAGVADAQPVYRCGDSYSQQPCPGGKLVETDDPRSASQRAQTTEAARRDGKLADRMEKARLKEEAKPAPAVILAPSSGTGPQPAKPASAPRTEKKPAQFTADSPAAKGDAVSGKKKKKKSKKKPVA